MMRVKTNLWYVAKAYTMPIMNITKAHLVDDDCNEYIAIIKCSNLQRGYYSKDLNKAIIDLEKYDRYEFEKLEQELPYSHYLAKI